MGGGDSLKQSSLGGALALSQALSKAGCPEGGPDSFIQQVFIKHLQCAKGDPAANKTGRISALTELTFHSELIKKEKNYARCMVHKTADSKENKARRGAGKGRAATECGAQPHREGKEGKGASRGGSPVKSIPGRGSSERRAPGTDTVLAGSPSSPEARVAEQGEQRDRRR